MDLELQLLFDQLPPVRTAAVATITARSTLTAGGDSGAAFADDDGYATPTSADSVMRAAAAACPPAPRKPRPPRWSTAKRKHGHCYYSRRRYNGGVLPPVQPRWIIAVPHDLAVVFVTRRPASPSTAGISSTCRPPAGKKTRVHVVG